jgi:hypothetical protein
MFSMDAAIHYVKSAYELIMSVIIATKEKRLILSLCRNIAFSIMLDSGGKLVALVECCSINVEKSGESILIVILLR